MLGGRQHSLLQTSSSNSNLLNSSGMISNPGAVGSMQSPPIDEKSVKDIIQILNKCIEKTKNLTEFSQVAQVDNIEAPSISGHTDFYYPNLIYQLAQYQQELPEITKIKRIPIPHELVEQFNQMQMTCYMGLFTCITRAWLTIDNLIFFWNYEDGSDISFYDNLTEAILSVELFRPKPGTFDEGIEYGLCLATNTTVVMLSIDFIRFTKGNGAIVNEMKFSPQPVYSILTENTIINTIKASKQTGRLFLGAKDGCLYEFSYQNQANWFGSQTKRINLSQSKFHYFVPSFFNFNDADSIVQIELDESRNVLYTRSENSTIQVFYLGANGMETSKISYLTSNTIATKAATLINSNDKNLFTQIVHIASMKKNESKNINLVAVTKFGIRLYFSIAQFEQLNPQQNMLNSHDNQNVNQSQYQYIKNSNEPQVPTTFQLVHVRIPPNIDMTSQNRQGPISSAFLNDGISIMISKRDENFDSVLLLNRDEFLLHSNFKESKSIFDIDGRIWSVDEVLPTLSSIKTYASENDLLQTIKSASGVENIPKLSAEFFDCPRRFVMMTPQGCFIWNKLRPIDQLYLVLKESNGPNSEGVRLFFNKIYERSEACALCLAVALMHSNEPRIHEWATHAFFVYSGEPEIKKKSATNFIGSNPLSQSQNLPGQFAMPQQPQVYHHQQQHYNPHSSLISETGNETINQTDQTFMNNNPYMRSQQHQQQQQTKANFGMSYLNSPQQMSTPIVMRTKDQFNASPQSQSQQNFQQMPQVPISAVQGQMQQNRNPDIQLKQLQSECEIHFSGKHDAIYNYLSRLLAPIWDLKLLCELTPGSRTNDENFANTSLNEPLSFATFTEIDLQWFLNKLNELKRFLDLNFAHLKTLKYNHLNSVLFGGFGSPVDGSDLSSSSAQQSNFSKLNQQPGQLNQMQPRFATQFSTMPINLGALINLTSGSNVGGGNISPITEEKLAIEIENGSIYLIKQFLNRVIEVIGLWKILDDHKYHFISTKLDEQTQLILMRMQIKSFFLADNNLLEKLITALLYRYIDDNACTDLLNQSLKQMCPSLYSNENAIYSKACEKLKQAINIKNDNYERERLLKEAVDLMKQIGYVANLSQVCETLQSAGCYEAIFELCLTAVEKRDPQNIGLYYYRKSEPSEDTQGQYYFNLRAECYKCMLEVLNSLLKTPSASAPACGLGLGNQQNRPNKENYEDQINALIKYIVNSKDELAHVSLFNWMLTCGYEKKLVTVDSQFLENYLVREIKDQTKNRVFLDLLWRHYDFKKDYQNAAKVLTALAEKYSESQISLKERVEYLTQAIVALNSTQKISVKDEVSELNDKKDVALLQEKIYIDLSQLDPRTDAVQDALIQLDSQLFDITKLYYEFAEKFDLYQCQLAIFKMARHDDPKIVEIFWKQIIATELDKMADIKQSDLKNQLADNIVNIAKEYVDEEKYFPLVTLIDSLEFVSLSRGFEPEWGSNLLRKLNIPFNQLIQEYNRVYSRKDIKWAENSTRFIETIYCLIDIFTKAPNATNESDKIYFLRTVKDLIPKYMTELNSINDELSKELISKFKTLNYMLERM